MTKSRNEWTTQEAIYTYLCQALPTAAIWGADVHGKLTPLARIRMKNRGIIAGIHDLFVFNDGVLVTLEIKDKSGVRDSQADFARRIINNKGYSFVAHNTKEAEAACREAGLPLRATSMTTQERDEKLAIRFAAPKKAASKQEFRGRTSRARIARIFRIPEPVDTSPRKP